MELMLQYLSINMTTIVMIIIAFLILSVFALTLYELMLPKTEEKEEENYLEVEEPLELQTKIRYVEEDPELEKTKAKMELKALREELMRAEEEKMEVASLAPVMEEIIEEAEEQVEETEQIQEELEEPKILETFSPIEIVNQDTKEMKIIVDKKEEPKEEKEEEKSILSPISIPDETFEEELNEVEEIPTVDEGVLKPISIREDDDKTKKIEIEKPELKPSKEMLFQIDEEFKSSSPKPHDYDEEDVIISFDELNKVIDQKTEENELRYLEEEKIPISIDELYATIQMPKIDPKNLDKKNELDSSLEKIDEELEKTRNLLNILQGLRRNLN